VRGIFLPAFNAQPWRRTQVLGNLFFPDFQDAGSKYMVFIVRLTLVTKLMFAVGKL